VHVEQSDKSGFLAIEKVKGSCIICQVGSGAVFQARSLAFREATQHRLQRTAASPLAGMRREPAKVLVGEGVLPAPPLPLKPTVRRFLLNCSKGVGVRREVVKVEQQGSFLQVEFRVSAGLTCQVGQVGSLGGGGFGYLCCFQIRV
jgi:hypothetical protein